MSALRVEHLLKRYGGLTVTDDLSLEVRPGELHAVIGPNGAGKTTLIGQLSGELRPDGGRVLLDGVDVTRMPIERRAARAGALVPDHLGVQALHRAGERGHGGAGAAAQLPLLAAGALDAGAAGARPRGAGTGRPGPPRRCRPARWRMASCASWSWPWCWPAARPCCCWMNPWRA